MRGQYWLKGGGMEYQYFCISISKSIFSNTFLTYLLSISASVPVFISPPVNQTALDGKDATLVCHAEGAPAPNVTWYFNGKCFYLKKDHEKKTK